MDLCIGYISVLDRFLFLSLGNPEVVTQKIRNMSSSQKPTASGDRFYEKFFLHVASLRVLLSDY